MKKRFLTLLLTLCLLLCGCEWGVVLETQPTTAPAAPLEDTLAVHFIDVGQADCALLECGGEYMLIDGGNREDGQKVVSYLDSLGITELDTVICTHAHEDHVGGLPAVLAVFPTENILSPTVTYSSNIFEDFLHYADQQRIDITIPSPGDSFMLGDAEVTILGPVTSYAETNDTSIVCRVDYGATSFLFTGDMETAAENDMLDAGADVRADVLKVGHHGSNTSTGYRFLNEVSPTYAVISCGVDNSYGHPHDEPMSRLEQAECVIFRTDEMGTILAISDGAEILFTWDIQTSQPAYAEPGEKTAFIGNRNSHVFHAPDCSNLPGEANRVTLDSYEEAIAAGYTPCGGCLK